jgi:hypothetical protein
VTAGETALILEDELAASWFRRTSWLLAGFIILIVPCAFHLWRPCTSTINPYGRAPREIDEWTWAWLRPIYGNREDGDSGERALIWPNPAVDPATTPLKDGRVLYMPDVDRPRWCPRWLYASARAYAWSAWRNNVNELSR